MNERTGSQIEFEPDSDLAELLKWCSDAAERMKFLAASALARNSQSEAAAYVRGAAKFRQIIKLLSAAPSTSTSPKERH